MPHNKEIEKQLTTEQASQYRL